ncbi:gamma interferon inducible lysosomal thiol reductase (GILT) domain-containing protein [Ditylenchus destructor]|nr:gamma interferon inducible lysosomal thiol reductase (GILT) domain-containing protein [Ditylenchus destructor]
MLISHLTSQESKTFQFTCKHTPKQSLFFSRVFLFVTIFLFIPSLTLSCTLPPDFWCDHPDVSAACTGSSLYCDRYKAARRGRPVDLGLAFESACPDSQQFVVYRLYPKLLSQPFLTPMVHFKPLPWGLAKRESGENVHCHHGPRECTGNRLLTCSLLHFQNDHQKQHKFFYCFMSHMMYKGDPTLYFNQCFDQLSTVAQEKASILGCANGQQATDLQKVDEIETGKILSKRPHRFVPHIAVNGFGHIHVQAIQMVLAEKIRAWNHTVAYLPPQNQNVASSCHTPPDFWCSEASITNACFNPQGCANYLREIYGKPIHIRVIYNSRLPASRRYVLGYVKPHFVTFTDRHNQGKFVLDLEPAAIAPSLLSSCDAACQEQAFQECIASKQTDQKERNNLLICLLENRNASSVREWWTTRCARDNVVRDNVLHCVQNQEWRRLTTQRAVAQQSLKPEPRRRDPWIVINGYSLGSMQLYSHILHRAICLWYRGAGHDREMCSRCEYEPTHC